MEQLGIEFEAEFRAYLEKVHIPFQDGTSGTNTADFTVKLDQTTVYIELKSRSRFNPDNWPGNGIPSEHFFIVDELTLRRFWYLSPRVFLVIKDGHHGYVVFSLWKLLTSQHKRYNRPLASGGYKGKWAIDLRNGRRCKSLWHVLRLIRTTIELEDSFRTATECLGRYAQEPEQVPLGGEVRTQELRSRDRPR